MVYKLLVNFTVLLHFLWILFLIFGFLLALGRPKMAFFHIGGLLFSLSLNIFGWYCPLTYLENYLRLLHEASSPYRGPFIANYLERFVYPDLPVSYIRGGEIFFVLLYVVFYAYLFKRYGILKGMQGH